MEPITLPSDEAGPSDMLPSGSKLDLVYSVHDGEGNANFHDTVIMPRGSSAPVSADGARLGAQYLTYRGIGSEAQLESAAGVAVVAKNATVGTVDWHTDAGLDQIKWPREHVQVTSPVGTTMNTTVQPTLESATMVARGSLWIVRSGGSAIELINYTS